MGGQAGLGDLEELLAALDPPSDRDGVACLLGLRDKLDALVAHAVGAFDAGGDWALDGALSAVAWLAWQGRMHRGQAARWVSLGRLVRACPITAAAWRDGTLSSAQSGDIAARTHDHLDRYAQHEAELVGVLAPLNARHTRNAVNHWVHRAAAAAEYEKTLTADAPSTGAGEGERPGVVMGGPAAGDEPDEAVADQDGAHGAGDVSESSVPSRLFLSETLDGRFVLDGDLDPVVGALVRDALRLYGVDDATVPVSQRRAGALAQLCRFGLDHRDHAKAPRHRPHLTVHITGDAHGRPRPGPGVTDDGTLLPAPFLGVLWCDCVVQRVVWSPEGHLLDFGKSTRTVPNGLRRAVITRDRHCRWPGCDRPASWSDVHHVIPSSFHGDTALGNLVLLCGRHHHLLHRLGWEAKLLPDATFVITNPEGRTFTSRPPPRL